MERWRRRDASIGQVLTKGADKQHRGRTSSTCRSFDRAAACSPPVRAQPSGQRPGPRGGSSKPRPRRARSEQSAPAALAAAVRVYRGRGVNALQDRRSCPTSCGQSRCLPRWAGHRMVRLTTCNEPRSSGPRKAASDDFSVDQNCTDLASARDVSSPAGCGRDPESRRIL
jgi:hypothetical protein